MGGTIRVAGETDEERRRCVALTSCGAVLHLRGEATAAHSSLMVGQGEPIDGLFGHKARVVLAVKQRNNCANET